jgi:organic radical activating enzyme
MMKMRYLRYSDNYEEQAVTPVSTLQCFITNRCNLRCKGCFYAHSLGKEDMSLVDYIHYIQMCHPLVEKITLLGGEPTLHPDLEDMIRKNQEYGLRTTIYTNGKNIERLFLLSEDELYSVSLRIGVHGFLKSEKPLCAIPKVDVPSIIVYMLRKDNVDELLDAAYYAEERLHASAFFLSSIREMDKTHSFWRDTADTLSNVDYAVVVQSFLDAYRGSLDIHISTRGVFHSEHNGDGPRTCRFGNVFPDGTMIQCPLDISQQITAESINWFEKPCTKGNRCVLQKIVLRNKNRNNY